MAQLMPLPHTASCFSKIQIGFTFLVPAHPGSPGQRAVKRGVCMCVCVCVEPRTSGRSVDAGHCPGSGAVAAIDWCLSLAPVLQQTAVRRCCYRSTGQTDNRPASLSCAFLFGHRVVNSWAISMLKQGWIAY